MKGLLKNVSLLLLINFIVTSGQFQVQNSKQENPNRWCRTIYRSTDQEDPGERERLERHIIEDFYKKTAELDQNSNS